jgi:hypothetical protein
MTTTQQTLALDHVVLVVTNLKLAIAQFQSNGFTVVEGGTNGPTHNALITFADGTYIELIALRSLATRAIFRLLSVTGSLGLRRLVKQDFKNRLFRWFGGPKGFSDICFRVTDLDAFHARCAEIRFPLTTTGEFRRQRPDGIDVRWRLAGAIDDSQAFFIEDITPIQYRIPEGKSREHVNGAIGITRVTSRVSLEQRPTDIDFRTAPDLGSQRFTITLGTSATVKSHLEPSSCCGALIEFE